MTLITDEMVTKAFDAFDDDEAVKQRYGYADDLNAIRAALEAIAPDLIEAWLVERASWFQARADDWRERDPSSSWLTFEHRANDFRNELHIHRSLKSNGA